MEQQIKQNTGQRGWFEPRKETVTNKGVRSVAPRHYSVSRKKECTGNVMSEPFAPPNIKKPEEVILQFEKNIEEDKEFNELMDDFFKENPSAKYDIKKNQIEINAKYADALTDFLMKNDIDCDIFEDVDEVDEIIEEVQEGRKPTAVAIDNSKTAKKVGNKEDADDLVDWIKEPGKSDLRDVDTKK